MSFKSVERKIAKNEKIPLKNAGAILANASRNASPEAKRKNPKLKKVKGKQLLTVAVLEGFVGSVLASKFDDAVATPNFHREGWELFTSKDKQVALAAPRG